MTNKIFTWCWLIIMFVSAVIISKGYSQTPYNQNGPWTEENIENERMWNEPILSDLLYENSFTGDLQVTLGLNKGQLTAIKKIAENVLLEYRLLKTESNIIVSDENLTLEEKKENIKEMGYNHRVVGIVNSADEAIKAILNHGQYLKFLDWAEQKYEEAKKIAEEYKHKPMPDISNAPQRVLPFSK